MNILEELQNKSITHENLYNFIEGALEFDWAAAYDEHEFGDISIGDMIAGIYWYCKLECRQQVSHELQRILGKIYTRRSGDESTIGQNETYVMLAAAERVL